MHSVSSSRTFFARLRLEAVAAATDRRRASASLSSTVVWNSCGRRSMRALLRGTTEGAMFQLAATGGESGMGGGSTCGRPTTRWSSTGWW